MAIRLAINGFGRIGRTVMRCALATPGVEVVAINDRMDVELMAFLFKRDSVHGPYAEEVSVSGNSILIGDREVKALQITDDLMNLPWGDLKVDIVLAVHRSFQGSGKGRQAHTRRRKKSDRLCSR